MAFTKIKNSPEYRGDDLEQLSNIDDTKIGVEGLPDIPNMSAGSLKAKFDEIAKRFLAPLFNKHIAELEAKTAAASIGAENGTVQSELNGKANANEVYTKEQTDAAINQKVVNIGSGDMAMAVYDPNGHKQDIFAYADAIGTKMAGELTMTNAAVAAAKETAEAALPVESAATFLRVVSWDADTGTLVTETGVISE